MKKAFLFLFFSLLNACAVYTSGYIPDVKKINIKDIEQNYKKTDITFSVDFPNSPYIEEKTNLEKEIIKEIKEFFSETHIFNKIHFVPFKERSSRHMHFNFFITKPNIDDEAALGLLSGYTLMTLPVWISQYTDINMLFYVNRKERLALSVAEKETLFLWLPLIIITPFFNPISVEARIRENAFKYFLNAIIEEKLYE